MPLAPGPGELVECRIGGNEEWRPGVVLAVEPDQLHVDVFNQADFTWSRWRISPHQMQHVRAAGRLPDVLVDLLRARGRCAVLGGAG